MKQGGRVYIIAGVVLAVLAGTLLFVYLKGFTDPPPTPVAATPVPKVDVIVAAKDVPAGTILTGDMLKSEQRLVTEAGPEAVRTPSEALDRVVVMPVKAGTPLKQSDIQTIPFVLPKGKRAMALPVDDMSTVAGLVREKDFVDIVVTGKVKLDDGQDAQGTPGARPTAAATPQPRNNGASSEDLSVIEPVDNQTVVKAVLQRVEVLKVVAPAPPQQENRQEQAPPDVPPATATAQARARAQAAENRGRISGAQGIIVLAVSNQEAEVLRYARDAAGFQLLLRGRDDADKEDTKGMTLDILIRDYGLPVPKPVVVDLRPE